MERNVHQESSLDIFPENKITSWRSLFQSARTWLPYMLKGECLRWSLVKIDIVSFCDCLANSTEKESSRGEIFGLSSLSPLAVGLLLLWPVATRGKDDLLLGSIWIARFPSFCEWIIPTRKRWICVYKTIDETKLTRNFLQLDNKAFVGKGTRNNE